MFSLVKKIIALLLMIVLLTLTILFFSFYVKDFKKENTIFKNAALAFESLVEVKSYLFSIFNFIYVSGSNIAIKKIYLKVENSSLEKSAIDRKRELNKYYKSKISISNESYDNENIKFRMRGKNKWHHEIQKPSLRIVFNKDHPYHGMNHVNLTSPEGRTLIENYYSDLISKRMGLIAHYGELVELYINKKYYGVYHLHSREDESMIRLNKRMPGPIYLGKHLNEKWDEKDFEVINLESLKDTPLKNFNALSVLVENLYLNNNWSNQNKLWKILDFDKTARWVAAQNILGSIHSDYEHNHELYFDKTTGKIEPILSDALSLGTFTYPWGINRVQKKLQSLILTEKPNYKISINQKTNPILNKILIDPEFYNYRNKIIYEYLKTEFSFSEQKKILKSLYDTIDKSVYQDQHKKYIIGKIGGWGSISFSNFEYELFKENVFYFLKNRIDYLLNEIENNEVRLKFLSSKDIDGKILLEIRVKGNSGVELNLEKLGVDKIWYIKPSDLTLNTIDEKKILFYPGLKIVKTESYQTNTPYRGQDIFQTNEYDNDFQTYILCFDEKFKNNFKNIANNLINNITGEKIKNVFWDKEDYATLPKINYNKFSLHVWDKNYEPKNLIILGPGDVHLKKNLFINKNQELKILPGTTLTIHPKVSIYSEGKVSILGTENKMIKIKSVEEEKPWGVFAVWGSNTDGSEISYLDISGGSEDVIENKYYSGMMSFFWNKNIKIKNSNFSKNKIGDDTLHFSNSKKIIIEESNFSNCNQDCIDLDYSSLNMKNSTINNSGNDGLDLMESQVYLENLNIIKAGDKGISGGEHSDVVAKNLFIQNSVTGIGAKDKTVFNLSAVNFVNNQVAIDIYKKNWRYGGEGKVIIEDKYSFKNNEIDIRTTSPKNYKFLQNINEKKLNIINK